MGVADWTVVIVLTAVPALFGLFFTRSASQGGEEQYFTAGRKLSWWAVGISNTATYHGGMAVFVMLFVSLGLSSNWLWWSQWVIWMPLVAVIWARMWRRMQVVTTAQLISLRYGGRPAKAARNVYALSMFCFSAVLLGYGAGFFAKSLQPLVPLSEAQILLTVGIATLAYTMLGGLMGSVMAATIQSIIFMLGSFLFAGLLIHNVGGLDAVLIKVATYRPEVLNQAPVSDIIPPLTLAAFIIIGILSPGSPVAGEGWTAQRFMAARNERHAIGGQLFNAFLALPIRTFPIIGVGLVATSVFWYEGLISTHGAIPAGYLPLEAPEYAWGQLLVSIEFPVGFVGLVVSMELAAFVSSLSALINWGAGFVANDLCHSLWPRLAQTHGILVSRLASALLFACGAVLGIFFVENVVTWFVFINSAVVIFWLPLAYFRFFWSRFNVWGELAASVLALPLSWLVWMTLGFGKLPVSEAWKGLGFLLLLAFVSIVGVTLITPPESDATLAEFYKRCRPMAGWRRFRRAIELPPNGDPPLRKLVADSFMGIFACIGMVTVAQSILLKNWIAVFIGGIMAVAFGAALVYRSLGQSGQDTATAQSLAPKDVPSTR